MSHANVWCNRYDTKNNIIIICMHMCMYLYVYMSMCMCMYMCDYFMVCLVISFLFLFLTLFFFTSNYQCVRIFQVDPFTDEAIVLMHCIVRSLVQCTLCGNVQWVMGCLLIVISIKALSFSSMLAGRCMLMLSTISPVTSNTSGGYRTATLSMDP